jgi:uroporphyrinogen decarboxylase
MHPRVESLPRAEPDYRRFLATVYRRNTGPIPLVELAVDPEVIAALLDEPLPRSDAGTVARRVIAQRTVQILHRLGNDVVKTSAPIPFDVPRLHAADTARLSRGERHWQDAHRGRIHTADDLEGFRWPALGEVDFGPVEAAIDVLPDGMSAVGFCGGVLEFATYLMGLERFMFAVYDAPDLVAAVLDNVGRTIYGVFELYCQMDAICAIWLGDDLGSKNGLLVGPDLLGIHVFPWYKRYAELAHRNNRPFLLHSCGDIRAVMRDLVEEVGIDAKHSFEDAIMPVERFIEAWGTKVGTLGGIDVNLLAQGSEEAVAARTREVLDRAAPSGGYACGSGNSITNYVPPGNYLAMIETVAAFNGRS